MTINIYPSLHKGKSIVHVSNWDDGLTLNISNLSFQALMNEYGIQDTSTPRSMAIRTMENILKYQSFLSTYAESKRKHILEICEKGKKLGATHISFS